MEGTSRSQTTSTKLQKIAEQAAQYPEMVFTTLLHLVDVNFLTAAYCRIKRDSAPGLSGITAYEYEMRVEENIEGLYQRLKDGQYRAQPLKRVWIEKEDKSKRPIAIPELEDKIVQMAVVMLLEPIYEQEFYDFSFGFRKGRNPHQAIHELREQCMNNNISWILDADISGYFDTIDHEKLKSVIKTRVNDGGIIRLIGKWLKAGIQEGGTIKIPEKGAPQGGVASPILSNIYLHYVLDDWYMKQVKPRLKGKCFLIRYADDFVLAFEREEDARRMLDVLPKRFAKYGLTIHPTKTKLIKFKRPNKWDTNDKKKGTFDFLGFTHYWARSRKKNWVIKRKTMRKRQNRTLKRIWKWCKDNRHVKFEDQYRTLCVKIRGHYNYYGIKGNIECLVQVYKWLIRSWKYWLNKRSQRGYITWSKLYELLNKYPLPTPKIVQQV